jgi:pimeloyl-ACP methyl ester carboxylesterase
MGLRTRLLEAGPGEGDEAVVFLHGGPGSANDFDDLLPRTGEFARAVAFDYPGWGRAEKPGDYTYSPDAYALFTAAALNELGIRRAHLVLGDIGAVAALHWAVAHPDAFASLVAFGSGLLIDYRWHPLAQLHRPPILGPISARSGKLFFTPAMRLMEPKMPKETLRYWRRDYDWGTRRAILRFWRAEMAGNEQRLGPALRGLDRPALFIWGRRDRFVPAEQAQRQLRTFPSAQVEVFEESFHYPHLDSVERTRELVIPFLRRQLELA